METSKKDYHEPSVINPGETTTKRPKTFFQRLSSGFTSLIPEIPLRRTASKNKIRNRPKTVPDLAKPARNTSKLQSPTQSHSPSHIAIPKLSEPEKTCPYDPNRIHFYGSIEDTNYSFCGLRSSSRTTATVTDLNTPCNRCQSRSRLSHIASVSNWSRRRSRANSTPYSDIVCLTESLSPLIERPRVTSNADSASRAAGLPVSADLPGNRVPSYSDLRRPQPQTIQSLPERHALEVPLRGSPPQSRTSIEREFRPISPKLHHFPGLAEAKSHPYIHRHEIRTNMTALRAGSPSLIKTNIDDATDPIHQVRGFPSTIDPSSDPSLDSSPTTINLVQQRGNLVIDEARRGGIPTFDLQLSQTDVYQRESPERKRRPSHPPARQTTLSTLTTPTPSTIDGQHLELKGGKQTEVKLRGGGKKRSSTCSGFGKGGVLNQEDESPPHRALVGEDVVRENSWAKKKVRLPDGISRSTRCLLHDACSSEYHIGEEDTARFNATKPRLRGGGIPGTWLNSARLPPTLYWLAGGRGKSSTVKGWKKQRGKKRMSGLLGMAVYGSRAGMAYEAEGPTSNEVEISVEVHIEKCAKSGEKSGTGVDEECPKRSSSLRPGSAGGVTMPVHVIDTPPANDSRTQKMPVQGEAVSKVDLGK